MTRSQPIFPQAPAVGDDTPLRLHVAAAVAFPGGEVSAKSLRLEAGRGRLVIERVAGKYFTTLSHIKRMRELCRLEAKAQDSGSATSGETPEGASAIPPSGSSATESIRKAHDAALTIAEGLSGRSPPTSRGSTSTPRRKGNVVPIRSRSRTS